MTDIPNDDVDIVDLSNNNTNYPNNDFLGPERNSLAL